MGRTSSLRPRLRRPFREERASSFCIKSPDWLGGVTLVVLSAREAVDQMTLLRAGGFQVSHVTTIDGDPVTPFVLVLLAVDCPILVPSGTAAP